MCYARKPLSFVFGGNVRLSRYQSVLNPSSSLNQLQNWPTGTTFEASRLRLSDRTIWVIRSCHYYPSFWGYSRMFWHEMTSIQGPSRPIETAFSMRPASMQQPAPRAAPPWQAQWPRILTLMPHTPSPPIPMYSQLHGSVLTCPSNQHRHLPASFPCSFAGRTKWLSRFVAV